jgi:hypothetical protein
MNTYQGALGRQFVVTDKPFLLMAQDGPRVEFDSEAEMKGHIEKVKITNPHIAFSTMYQNQNGKWVELASASTVA